MICISEANAGLCHAKQQRTHHTTPQLSSAQLGEERRGTLTLIFLWPSLLGNTQNTHSHVFSLSHTLFGTRTHTHTHTPSLSCIHIRKHTQAHTLPLADRNL